jgi:putative transport protein
VHWLTDHISKPYPELLIFITVAIGFLVGKLHWKSIGLGAVTGCLIAGLVTGWATGVAVNGTVKSVFFIMFLFALGYKVGPQFFRGLRKDGLPQVAVAVVVCLTGLLVCYGFARMLGYDTGLGAGLLGGALTQSAVIGVAQDAIANLPKLSASQITVQQKLVPVAYAVTYPLGTILCAILLANIAPRLLRSDLKRDSAVIAKELDVPSGNPDLADGYYEVVLRAYRVAVPGITGRTWRWPPGRCRRPRTRWRPRPGSRRRCPRPG